jgi:hypothetical protein
MLDNSQLQNIHNLQRMENLSRNEMSNACMELTHAIYPHNKIYGQYCTIQEYINCPPETLFHYLANPKSLQQWTYSMRNMVTTADPNIVRFDEHVADETYCYCKTISNFEAMTVDYHCAWDQAKHLWMIYLMRIIPAQEVLNKTGTVVIWSNCYHPFYEKNPYPETAPSNRELWVGDIWDMFYAGHWIEMQNLKKIMEFQAQ